MSNIRIESTQNVAIDFELAGVSNRIGAMLIDLCIWVVYILVVANLLNMTEYGLYIEWLLYSPLAFYHLIFEILMNGQSPGKKALKLKVIKIDGSKPSLGDYVTRWVFRMVDTFGPIWAFSTGEAIGMLFTSCLFGIVSIISISVSKKDQRIGDMAAGTTVVVLKKRASLEDTVLSFAAKNYKVKIDNVLMLSDRDIRIIKKALDIYERTDDGEHIQKLAKKAATVLGIKYKGAPVKFLKTIIKDYNVKANEVEGNAA